MHDLWILFADSNRSSACEYETQVLQGLLRKSNLKNEANLVKPEKLKIMSYFVFRTSGLNFFDGICEWELMWNS